MIQPLLSFFSATFQCFTRTREQREFEEKLYIKGLEEEQAIRIKELNQKIVSKELATKFVLQELDVARQGDTVSQKFAKNSGFHLAEYLGALKKFEEDREEIEKIQFIFLDFLNKIANEKTMFQTATVILNGVMEYWEIGKYSEEGKFFFQEEKIEKELPTEKKAIISSFKLYIKQIKILVMEKLLYADNKIQDLLDAYAVFKEEKKLKKELDIPKSIYDIKKEQKLAIKIYTDEKVDALMEEYSNVIEDVITGDIHPENIEEIETFQEQMSLATLEGNNLASVFCAFFEVKQSFPSLPLSIIQMDNKSKTFFIEILNTFYEKGFSENLHKYLEENREIVYALATKNDMFMQYLIAFWYVSENEDGINILKEQEFWYAQSALNGFKPAIQKMKKQ